MKEENGAQRPYGIYLRDCQNILIKDLHLKNSAFWMLRIYRSSDIRLSGIDLYNHANTNNDGIDIVDCHRVVISDCVIDSSDDALCFKSESPFDTEDIVVNNCILSSTASALKFGTGSYGYFKRINVSNVIIRPTKSEKILHALKIPAGIDGISVMSVDGADIKDLHFSNISIKGVLAPIFIRLNQRHKISHSEYNDLKITSGTIDGIYFNQITARDCVPISSSISGYPNHYVKNIHFSNVYLNISKPGTLEDIQKNVPENDKGYPNAMMFGTNLPVYGFYFRHAKQVNLNNIYFKPAPNEVRKAIYLEDVHQFNGVNLFQNFETLSKEHLIQKNNSKINIE